MAEFKAFTGNVEVNGQTVLAVVSGLGGKSERARELLADNGIENPQPGNWYPQQAWLDTFADIAQEFGPDTLYEIGRRIPESALFPKGGELVETAFQALNAAYHINHRGGSIGQYTFVKTGDHSAHIECKNPYPCDFDRGLLNAIAENIQSSSGIKLTIKHEDGTCRKNGAASCTFLIEWHAPDNPGA